MKYLVCTGAHLNFFLVLIPCNFHCFKPFVQLCKGNINAILNPVAFDVVSNDTGIISKEMSTVCFRFVVCMCNHYHYVQCSTLL
jgi:hypothetical protein